MNTTDNISRAARHLIGVHGNAAENIARVRAENATASKRGEVATVWLQIAAEVRAIQGHLERVAAVP
jgi:uncharacterized protein (DUF934 family)